MTMRMDVGEGAARWFEIVAEVEAGRDVVIARGAVALATVKREPRPSVTAREAIFESRKGIPPTTAEEILAWRDEGRR